MVSEPTLVESSLFPRLVVKAGGRVVEEVELRGDLKIGRAEDNDLQLTDPKASRHHARLEQEGAIFVLIDLGSANGTRVNGLLVTEPHPLEHGDRIDIGDTDLTYQEPGRALQDTMPELEGVPTIEALMATEMVGAVPPAEEPVGGASRGLMIGLILVAAVVILAIAALTIYLLAPGVYEQIGLISPPTPASVIQSTSEPAPSPGERALPRNFLINHRNATRRPALATAAAKNPIASRRCCHINLSATRSFCIIDPPRRR